MLVQGTRRNEECRIVRYRPDAGDGGAGPRARPKRITFSYRYMEYALKSVIVYDTFYFLRDSDIEFHSARRRPRIRIANAESTGVPNRPFTTRRNDKRSAAVDPGPPRRFYRTVRYRNAQVGKIGYRPSASPTDLRSSTPPDPLRFESPGRWGSVVRFFLTSRGGGCAHNTPADGRVRDVVVYIDSRQATDHVLFARMT